MDIMSDSKEKTLTVSPDPGATGETAKFKRWEERESQSKFLKIMRRIKELLELFHDLQGQEYDALLQDMELWIENGAAAKNKNKAPPAKTTKGEGKIKSEKIPNVLPDQGTSGGKARKTLPKLRVGYKLN